MEQKEILSLQLQGWETYPENLAYRGCDLYGYHLASYRHQIESDAERLFTSVKDRIAVKVIEFDTKGATLRCECDNCD